VAVIESVRSRLQEPRFRAGFVDDKYDVYIDLVRLQLQLGRTGDAFSTAERLRARTFAEQLGGRSTLPLTDDGRRREAQLLERIRQLQRALAEDNPDVESAYPQRAMSRFSQELQRAEQEYQAFLDDHTSLRDVSAPTDSASSARQVQQRLADDEALVEYVVGPDSLMAFVVTRQGVNARTTPLRLVDLNARIALLRDLAQRPGDDRWLKPAGRLASDLIGPLEVDGWLQGIRRLYVVPHGVLNYLPFALLPTTSSVGGPLLIDRYAVAYLPAAAALLREAGAQPAPRSLLAMAPARSRLRYAPDEARSIDALFTPNSKLLVGIGATESQFKRLAGDFGMLHLATHGSFNKLNPLLSGVELEADSVNDGLLQVHEVLGLRLNADVVTLSACETALGSGYFAEVPAGDDFVGMTRAFLAAGSQSVVATLWDVDDQASVKLMQRFYGRMKQSSSTESTADSLTRAQRDLHASKELGHPYYWAPFVVVGPMNGAGRSMSLAAGR
jgi:CHAT domain-containing protein